MQHQGVHLWLQSLLPKTHPVIRYDNQSLVGGATGFHRRRLSPLVVRGCATLRKWLGAVPPHSSMFFLRSDTLRLCQASLRADNPIKLQLLLLWWFVSNLVLFFLVWAPDDRQSIRTPAFNVYPFQPSLCFSIVQTLLQARRQLSRENYINTGQVCHFITHYKTEQARHIAFCTPPHPTPPAWLRNGSFTREPHTLPTPTSQAPPWTPPPSLPPGKPKI